NHKDFHHCLFACFLSQHEPKKISEALWYPRVSSFDLESYSDSDYAGANLDRKSTIGVLDYGFNFMNTKIYIDNESTICIVKNLVYHSKTKHIAIRHHFIRDAYEKKLIQVLKIHTNDNVADILTKAFDVSQFQFLVVLIRMINPQATLVKGRQYESKNSLVKHFEDMRLYKPSKEYLLVWFDPPRDVSMSCLTTKGMRNNGAMCAREDLEAIYKLVMDIYQDKIPEGFNKVLWGDLIVMFNPDC
ncbi:hypothetical protein Tco_1579095, partial [Tanacetum coccineum]